METREFLESHGVAAELVLKVHEGRPHIVDRMINDDIDLVINTPFGRSAFYDDAYIRRTALSRGIPLITTLSAAAASVEGIRAWQTGRETLSSIQEQYVQFGVTPLKTT